MLLVGGTRAVDVLQERSDTLEGAQVVTDAAAAFVAERTARLLDAADAAMDEIGGQHDPDAVRRVVERRLGARGNLTTSTTPPGATVIVGEGRHGTWWPSDVGTPVRAYSASGAEAFRHSRELPPGPSGAVTVASVTFGSAALTEGGLPSGLHRGTRVTLSTDDGTNLSTSVVGGPSGTVREGSPSSVRRVAGRPLTVTVATPISTALRPWRVSTWWRAMDVAVLLAGIGVLTFVGDRLSRKEEAVRAGLVSAVAEKEALLQEIHHRVKNGLQIATALLTMQARRFKDPDLRRAMSETKDRLASVSFLHELLYRKEAGRSIRLDDYLRMLVDNLSSTYGAVHPGVRVELEAEPLELDVDKAVPVALVVTEAVTNSFKHAFARGEGTVRVEARRREGHTVLTVSDDGPGFPGGTAREGSLGMRLMTTLAGQVDARLETFNEGGASVRLSLPAPDAAAA